MCPEPVPTPEFVQSFSRGLDAAVELARRGAAAPGDAVAFLP